MSQAPPSLDANWPDITEQLHRTSPAWMQISEAGVLLMLPRNSIMTQRWSYRSLNLGNASVNIANLSVTSLLWGSEAFKGGRLERAIRTRKLIFGSSRGIACCTTKCKRSSEMNLVARDLSLSTTSCSHLYCAKVPVQPCMMSTRLAAFVVSK